MTTQPPADHTGSPPPPRMPGHAEEERDLPPAARVSAHALDVLFKLEAEYLVEVLPHRFQLTLAPVRRHLPTELPQLELHLKRLDRVFELADASILDLEFESELSLKDLRRFVGYGLALLDAYPDRPVHIVVLCGPRTRTAPAPLDLAPLPLRLTFVLIADQDGAAIVQRLRARLASGDPWSQADRLDLVFLPLYRHAQPTEAVVREGLALAQGLAGEEQRRAIGALLALAYHYAGEAAFDRLVEGLMHTTLLDQILEQRLAQVRDEGRAEGVAQGRAEGERALLRRYLTRRFGSIPAPLEERIAAADAEALTALFDRALAATTVETL